MKKIAYAISFVLIIAWTTLTLANTTSGLAYLGSQQGSNGIIGSLGFHAWAVTALGAYNQVNAPAIEGLKTDQANLSNLATTDIEKQIIALKAAGQNPRSFAGVDAVAALKARQTNGQFGVADFVNDDIFGVIAYKAASEPIPASVIQNLVAHQNADGGWSITASGTSSTDMTAVALIALKGTGVAQDVITKGTDYLKSKQNTDGGFATQSGASNLASTAWVRWFINTYGLSQTEWSQNGNSTSDYLLSQQAANGSWSNSVLLTSYSLIALSNKSFPFTGVTPPTPTPSPSPPPTPTPTPTPTPSISPSPTPSPSVSPTPSASPSPTPTPTVTPSSTPTPTPSPSSTPTPSPSPTHSPTPTPTFQPTSTPSPHPTITVTPTPTLTPTASVSHAPSPEVSSRPTPTPPPLTTQSAVRVALAPTQKKLSPTPGVVSQTSGTFPTLSPTPVPSAMPTLEMSPQPSAQVSPEVTASTQSMPRNVWFHFAFGILILGVNAAAIIADIRRARK